jgi:Asp-tRNA(Asn)/Glu-tRNA(Gln) amidotransferase A subunit family amidase
VESKLKGPAVIKPRVSLIARRVDDIKLVLDSLWTNSEENHLLQRYPHNLLIPFNDDIYYSDKSLKVGYFDSQSLMDTCPAVKRAVLTSYGHLTSLGYDLMKIN